MNVALQLWHLIRIIRPLYRWQQWHKLKWCSCLKCFTCWHLHFVTVNGNKCQYWTIIVRDFWSVKHPIQHFKTFILQGQLITDAANYEYTNIPKLWIHDSCNGTLSLYLCCGICVISVFICWGTGCDTKLQLKKTFHYIKHSHLLLTFICLVSHPFNQWGQYLNLLMNVTLQVQDICLTNPKTGPYKLRPMCWKNNKCMNGVWVVCWNLYFNYSGLEWTNPVIDFHCWYWSEQIWKSYKHSTEMETCASEVWMNTETSLETINILIQLIW